MEAMIPLDRATASKLKQENIKNVMVQLKIINDKDKDPSLDFPFAFDVIKKLTRKHETPYGFSLTVETSDAVNGYGVVEYWKVSITEYTEYCNQCTLFPNHSGPHKWRREWKTIASGSAFSPEAAICRALIDKALLD